MGTKLITTIVGIILVAWFMYWLLYLIPKRIMELQTSAEAKDTQQAARLQLVVKMAKGHPGIYLLFICVVVYLIWLMIRMFL